MTTFQLAAQSNWTPGRARRSPEAAVKVMSSLLRLLDIISLVTWHVICAAFRAAWLWGGARNLEFATFAGDRLASLCEGLGPTFIKAGQILSARPDLLPAGVGAPLVRLQDQLDPFDGRLIPKILELAFGRHMGDLFESFDLTPIASASIAQVHRARLSDGREVAVKIRRPGIAGLVDNDLRLLTFMARVLSSLPGMSTVPLPELIEDIKLPLGQQLDFHLEAANNRRFRSSFAFNEHIRIPELIEDLCTENVLTMEYFDKLRRTDSAELSAEQCQTAALAGLHALYKMIFIDGFIHADMHPGNVFLRDWGELVILDMGLVASLDDSDQRDFVDFFFGMVNNDGRECARIIIKTAAFRSRYFDKDAFEAAMVKLIGRHSALKSHEFEIALFVYQLIETQRKFKIRGSTKFMMTILSMVVFDGICKQLYPLCDFQQEARAFLITARYRFKRVH